MQSKAKVVPVAQLAETTLCRRLGLLGDDDIATAEAISRFIAMFNGRLPPITVAALRALFRLDCDLATAVEDALLEHGGAAGPGLEDAETTQLDAKA